ncbi:MAG: hypothetical protein ABIH59_03130 [archaeon]
MKVRLYHTVYRKHKGEDLLEKTITICEEGMRVEGGLDNLRKNFVYFNNSPQDKKNPVMIIDTPKNRVLVADGTDKTDGWSSTITQYELWEKDKTKIPYPEFLIGEVPKDYICGVLYLGKNYTPTQFKHSFRKKLPA